MSKSGLTYHKEILKKEHEQSLLGQIEKKLRKFYDGMVMSRNKLSEDFAKKVYDLREANEKAVSEYIELRLKYDREAIDNMLLDTMTKEWEILEEFNKQNG